MFWRWWWGRGLSHRVQQTPGYLLKSLDKGRKRRKKKQGGGERGENRRNRKKKKGKRWGFSHTGTLSSQPGGRARVPREAGVHPAELILHFMLLSPSCWVWQLAQPWLGVYGTMRAPADTISPDFMGIYSDYYHDSYFSNEVSVPGAQCFVAGVPPPCFSQWPHFHFPPRIS